MSKTKELFAEKMQESNSLGGLHHNQTAAQLEMSFPSMRSFTHQAADHKELDKVIDLVFALETSVGEA